MVKREVWQGLIAVEGIDGSGTTTLTKLLAGKLKDMNCHHQKGCEPTSGPIGDLIRSVLSGDTTITHQGLARLFAADRYEHLFARHGVREALEQGHLYVTDRYWFSSLAYQTLYMEWAEVEALNSAYPLPGHLIFLRVPADKAQDRLSRRSEKEIFDSANLQEIIFDNYHRAIEDYRSSGMRVLEVGATAEPQVALEQSLEFLSELLPV